MNATKFEKVLVTGICILAIVLVILLTVHMLWPEQKAAAAVTNVHDTAVTLPVYYGTVTYGERVTGGIPERSNACHTYNMGGRFGGNESQNAVACLYVSNSGIVASEQETSAQATVTAVTETVKSDKPVKIDDGSKPDKKQKCNNGNGNGGEGCNASDRGNNDETGDKADGRNNGNSGNSNGGGNGNGNGGNH